MTQTPHDMIEIDGSQGEGGGQILRTSLSLSVIRGVPVQFSKIRAKRDKPGLRPQHKTAAEALAALSQAHNDGIDVGSDALFFHPSTTPAGDHAISIGTAGATALLLHALYYPMALGPEGGSLRLTGGTHADKAPTFHYLHEVWAPLLRACQMQVELSIPSVGFYPRGGGQITAEIPGNQSPQGIQWLQRPPLDKISIISLFGAPTGGERKRQHQGNKGRQRNKRTSNRPKASPADITQRMTDSAQEVIERMGFSVEDTRCLTPPSASPGAVCHVFCHFGPLRAGFTAFGWKGRPAEQVGAEAAALACRFLQSEACLDEWSADQVLLPLSLATNDSSYTTTALSGHLETNAQIIQTFLPHVQISFDKSKPNITTVHVKHTLR